MPIGFLGGSDGKESACNAGYLGSIPELGRAPREGNGYSLHYSFLGNLLPFFFFFLKELYSFLAFLFPN